MHRKSVKPNFDTSDKEPDKFYFAANCVVLCFRQNQLQTLLRTKYKGHGNDEWRLLGDLVRKNEDLYDTQTRVMKSFLGATSFHCEQLKSHGPAEYDQFGLVTTTTFMTVVLEDEVDRKKMREFGIKWFGIKNLPKLLQNEKSLMHSCIEFIKSSMRTSPIGFKFLPQKFTMPQLRQLFETILEEDIDKRNFRNKLKRKGFVMRLEEKNWTGSRKGAYKYQFDEKKYDRTTRFNI
jgi:ADP-ribose pyrophosphatase YjhB (NUDIX family)